MIPRAIHLGLRRPGIRGGSGVAGAAVRSSAACCGGAAHRPLVVLGSMSMLIWGLCVWVRGGRDHRVWPVGTMLASAAPMPVTAAMPIMDRKIVGSVAEVRTVTMPPLTLTEPRTPG